jgi:hypothetical protein
MMEKRAERKYDLGEGEPAGHDEQDVFLLQIYLNLRQESLKLVGVVLWFSARQAPPFNLWIACRVFVYN